jgi:hypothetical protein
MHLASQQRGNAPSFHLQLQQRACAKYWLSNSWLELLCSWFIQLSEYINLHL